jgi:hypothetical protein
MNIHRSFYSVLFIILLGIFAVSLLPAKDISLKSTVSKVTVFSDRALITRSARETVPAGIQTILVPHLPTALMDQSLRVSGVSDRAAKITDVKIEQVFLDTIPESRKSDLYKRLNALRLEKNALERKNLLLKSQSEAVDALQENYTKSLNNPNPNHKAATEEWEKLLQFVERKKTDFADKMESLRIEIEVKQEKIQVLEQEIRNTTGGSGKAEKQVSVTLNVTEGGPIDFEVSYIISGVSWSPSYEARVTSTEKALQLFYYGMVQQTSGENWNNIDLILSTAQPAISSQIPSINKWNLDAAPVYAQIHRVLQKQKSMDQPMSERTGMGNTLTGRIVDVSTNEPLIGANIVLQGTSLGGSTNIDGTYSIYNIPEGRYTVSASMIGYRKVYRNDVYISKTTGAKQNFYLQAENIQGEEVVVMAQRSEQMADMATSASMIVQAEESTTKAEITSSSFTITSKQSIPSDNQSHKVGISLENLPIEFAYDIIPKSVQAAYLTGKGKNAKEYPLLAGETNVFLDNSFVATIPLKTIMPNDSFAINLGVDEAIRVERKLVSRFTEQVGTFSTKIRTTYEFEFKIENHKKYDVEVKLYDQIPVSRNEKIVVEQIEPNPKTMLPDADGILMWKLTLPANEKRSFKLKFSVERPPNVTAYGIE